MATDHGHGPDAGRNPAVAYDRTDLGARGILIFFVGLLVFAVIMHVVVLGLYAGMTRFSDKHEAETNPLAPQTYTPRAEILTNTANINVEQFPQPRLLHHVGGRGEMSKFLLRQAGVLTAEPWQDAEGNIHLPIDQAMKAVLPRLSARTGGTVPPNYPGAARGYSYPPAQPEAAAAAPETGNPTSSE